MSEPHKLSPDVQVFIEKMNAGLEEGKTKKHLPESESKTIADAQRKRLLETGLLKILE